MPYLPEHTTDAGTRCEPTLADPHRGPRAAAPLGLVFGDRFEAFRGGSGSFKERVLRAEKPAELQGKRSTERYGKEGVDGSSPSEGFSFLPA
jgi:hypothetical protein